MSAPRPPATPAWAAGLLAGTLCGAGAALHDYLRAMPELPRYLPDGNGTGRLLLFLLSLYGSLYGLGGLGLGLLLQGLYRTTALGPLCRALGQTARAQTGTTAATVPGAALALAAALAAAALGGAVYPITLLSLLHFHDQRLIAMQVAGVVAALVLPAAALGLLLLGALALLRPLRRAPVQVRFRGPPGLYVLGWICGLGALLPAVFSVLMALQKNRRMTPDLRALNLALWTPALVLLAVALGHALGRLLAGWAGRRGPLSTPAQVAIPALAVLLPAAALARANWTVLLILDTRPFSATFFGLVLAAAALLLLYRTGARPRRAALAALLAMPLVLWAVSLAAGSSHRVLKAALSQTALAGPLLKGAQTAFDLDRDGYPSRWAGGTDCDDLRADIHPGAFDWPDDGIDQDCNGHQATLQDEPVHPFPALPADLRAALSDRPNILLITIDALRSDHVSAYGYQRKTTPNLDALAARGALFREAWAHAPSTRYSVPAILTGRYPSTLSWGNPAQHWPPEVLPQNRLISEMLRARGYHTGALLSYHYFEPTWGLARGFDDYDVHLMSLHSMGGDPAATTGTSSQELADLAIGRLELAAAHKDQPFFLWVHFYDPHYRYQLHPGIDFGATPQDLYDGEIYYTDQHLGRVLEALKQSGQADRTVVMVSSDHGEGFAEHGTPQGHGYHLYAVQTRVPLVVYVPGLPGQPMVIDAPVGHVDFVPTLLNLCGGAAEAEPQLAGRSLMDLLLKLPGAQANHGQVFQEVMYEGPTTRKAVVTPGWHYIRNVIPDGTSELYDLTRDPREEHDLQGSPLVALTERDLSRRLAAWMDQSGLPLDFAGRVRGNVSLAPLPYEHPVGARLGDGLEVLGADGPKQPVQRGTTAEVTVIFYGRERIGPGWRLFAHLRAADGTFVNADHDLLQGLMPLQQVRPGQYIRDVIRIPIPATFQKGPATLEMGLFRGPQRAPVSGPKAVMSGGEDALELKLLVVR